MSDPFSGSAIFMVFVPCALLVVAASLIEPAFVPYAAGIAALLTAWQLSRNATPSAPPAPPVTNTVEPGGADGAQPW